MTGMEVLLSKNVLLAIVLAPLLGSIIAGLFGRLVGRAGAHTATILGVAVSCALSCWVLYQLVVQGASPFNENLYTFFEVGNYTGHVGFMIDKLTAMMMVVVTFVSLLVHLYTIGYMAEDPGYQRFFSYISLFTFSMLMLVMSNNFLQLYFGWEAVGLMSYLLIGFWYQRESAIFANLKAFVVNRVGDFGMILGAGLLLANTGSLNYAEVFAQTGALSQLTLPGTDWQLLTVACLFLFIGAMAKSAQVPLHIWLPDSMEGPTPISALIHAATMVTAGIFMVARMSPLYELSDTALNFVMVIGAITALFMGFVGMVQNDIKRIIAYSTISQLGYMAVALGASAYSVAIFHLMTHAFFKALLFLCSGSVILAMHHDQDIRNMGGLAKYMPITAVTTLIGSLALIATPFFSGFYSKDSIIEAVHASQLPGAGFAYFAVVVSVFVTAFYSFRLYFVVFHGKERFRHKPFPGPDDHGSDAHHGDSTPRESPWVVTAPLILLAIPSVVIGFMTIGPLLYGGFFDGSIVVDATRHRAMAELASEFHGATAMGLHSFGTLSFALALAGVVVTYVFYLVAPAIPAALARGLSPLMTILQNKFYFDWLNENVIMRTARAIGVGFWRGGDLGVIDGIINGSARTVGALAAVIRLVQNGYLYWYALAMLLGLFGLLTWQLWPSLYGLAH